MATDLGVLVLGEDLGHDLVDAEVGADGVGHLAGVAGDHDDPLAHGLELGHRFPGFRAQFVLQGQRPDDLALPGQVEDRSTPGLPSGDGVLQRRGLVESPFAQQGRAAHRVAAALHGGLDTAPGDGSESAGGGQRAALGGGGDNGPGQGMLAVGLHGAGQAQHLRLVDAGAGYAGQGVLSLGQGAGLVEEDGVDGPHPFEGQTVLDQDAGPGGQGAREGDHQRDGQTEGVGAGDDQHGHGADHGGVPVAEERPGGEGDDPGAGGHVEQPGGEPVGEGLGPAVR
jgi:hypothetical protein